MQRPWASNMKSSNMDVMSELGWWMVQTTVRFFLGGWGFFLGGEMGDASGGMKGAMGRQGGDVGVGLVDGAENGASLPPL